MSANENPWATYEPTPNNPWDLAKVAHLHRRAGFGATWPELQRDLRDGPSVSVDRYLTPRAPTAEERQVLDGLRQGAVSFGSPDRLKAWWLYRVLYDPDPLREKMTLFWHGHFATSNRKVESLPLMLEQNELLRRYALGSFRELVTAIVGDGAMLLWLDGAESNKEKPNENFARELLELFTLGVGHYTEPDIREAARAFTGWTVKDGKAHFDDAAHDAGPKTFLGQTGNWQAADIVRITLEQPACAELLCRKVYRFFVNEVEEPAALINPLAEELRRSRYDVGHVVGVLLRSKHFYDPMHYRQRVKSPVELSAGLVHTLEVPRSEMRLLALAVACEQQGQNLFYPPTVKGWDGGKTWLTSMTILERGNWGNDVVWGNANLDMRPFDPLAWANRSGVAPEKAAAVLLDLLLQGDLDEKSRALVQKTGQDGKPDSLRKALQLILHCPEHQLA
jgi:uncharacterized protein (DUF1800 family)